MKVTLGFVKYVEEDFDLPEKFEFIFDDNLSDDDWTEEQWDIFYDEYPKWKDKVTGCDVTIYDVDTIGVK